MVFKPNTVSTTRDSVCMQQPVASPEMLCPHLKNTVVELRDNSISHNVPHCFCPDIAAGGDTRKSGPETERVREIQRKLVVQKKIINLYRIHKIKFSTRVSFSITKTLSEIAVPTTKILIKTEYRARERRRQTGYGGVWISIVYNDL